MRSDGTGKCSQSVIIHHFFFFLSGLSGDFRDIYKMYIADIQRYKASELKEIITEKKLLNATVLEANEATIKSILAEWQQGIQLWKYFLLFAL